MRWSQTWIPTLREDPGEAEIESHKLLLRSGLLRRLAGGLYTFLPLGLRALRKVERVVREEMDRAGAIEVLMPALQPKEIWERSGRFDVLRDVMFRMQDNHDRTMVLGPTHEEVITDLAAREISSYRQLPKTFYQIQTKFRDEIRPRFGLMRAKEFVMKDAYSFDVDWDSADTSYQSMYDAYIRIFRRCGLETRIVEADAGAMGGKWSHEFMVLADAGEDGLAECQACSYAANLERAERAQPEAWTVDGHEQPLAEVETPGKGSIQEVSEFLDVPPAQLVKTLIYMVDGEPVAVCIAGDRDINEHKLARALEAADVALADDATVEKTTGAPVGFAGPVGLAIRVVADIGLQGCRGGVTGANRADLHLRHVDLERDATIETYGDLAYVREGDRCPRCSGALRERRGIEVGHVFKLGTKYSDAFGADFLDEEGQQQISVMGCYGIGVTRTLQAVIEQRHDEDGIIWPLSVAPCEVVLVAVSVADRETMDTAERLHDELEAAGIDVLFDDREERPGVKFKDADLLGLPIRIVVGERSLKRGGVEIKLRTGGDAEIVPVAEVAAYVRQAREREAAAVAEEAPA